MTEDWREAGSQAPSKQAGGTVNVMMQRWYEESMLDQPYHDIAAVRCLSSQVMRRSDGQESHQNQGPGGKCFR